LPRLLVAAFLLAACAPIDSSTRTDPCGDPRLPANRDCKAEPVLYLALDKLDRAVLVSADIGAVRGGDDLAPVPHYFLRTPEGQIVPLGEFRQGIDVYTSLAIERHLGIRMMGIGRLDYSIFRERIVVQRGPQQYCVRSRMKAPFVGELDDCDGTWPPLGWIGYAPQAVSATEAIAKACQMVLAQLARKCQYDDVDVLTTIVDRDPDGALFYKFTLRANGPRAVYLVYRVEALEGHASLLQQSHELPSVHMLWRQRPS
jgi:hypothetical protein